MFAVVPRHADMSTASGSKERYRFIKIIGSTQIYLY